VEGALTTMSTQVSPVGLAAKLEERVVEGAEVVEAVELFRRWR